MFNPKSRITGVEVTVVQVMRIAASGNRAVIPARPVRRGLAGSFFFATSLSVAYFGEVVHPELASGQKRTIKLSGMSNYKRLLLFLFFFSLMKRNKNQGLRKKKLKIFRQG